MAEGGRASKHPIVFFTLAYDMLARNNTKNSTKQGLSVPYSRILSMQAVVPYGLNCQRYITTEVYSP
jgi:hypothetical protein